MPDRAPLNPSADLVSDAPELTIEDICNACGISHEEIATYVAEGVVDPHGSQSVHWRFSRLSVIRVQRARRLEHDLGLNAAGAALAMQLMAEIETLRNRLTRYERDSTASDTKD